MVVAFRVNRGGLIMFPSYHVHRKVPFYGYVDVCKMCFCGICIYVRGKLSASNLAIGCCSKVFSMLFRSLFFGVFRKISFFHGAKCMEILTSASIDQVVSFLAVVDGAGNLE